MKSNPQSVNTAGQRPLRFSQLSPLRQQLVRLCQSTNHGQIQDLIVRNQEPVLGAPPPVVLRDVKLDSEDRLRDELGMTDFALCAEVGRLMLLLDRIQNGKISKIEVREGIPRRIVFESPLGEMLRGSP